MGQRRTVAGSDNGWKRHAFRSGLSGGIFYFRRDLSFGNSRANCCKRPLEEACTHQNCGSNALDFLRILHHARALHQVQRFAQADVRWKAGREPVSGRHGHALRVEAQTELRCGRGCAPTRLLLGVSGQPIRGCR